MQIDLLPFIPKTISGKEVFIEENGEFIKIWYKHPRIKPLLIKRFIDAKVLGGLLGQYQAEGTKYNKTKKKSAVEFSNQNVLEHKEFVSRLKDLGIEENLLVFTLTDTSGVEKETLEKYKQDFEKQVGKLRQVYVRLSKRGGYGYKTIFRSRILIEIVLCAMNTLRRASTEEPDKHRDFIDAFFAKLLAGDGTINPDKRFPVPRVHLSIKDENEEYQRDYAEMMKVLGFNYIKIYPKHFQVETTCTFENLLYLYKIRAFQNTNNWNKLLVTIGLFLKGNRLKTKMRFLELDGKPFFTTKDIVEMYNLHPNDKKWINNMNTTGFIKRINETSPYKYVMTEKALELKDSLKAWQVDLNKLMLLKGINDLSDLQYSLKAHPRLSKECSHLGAV